MTEEQWKHRFIGKSLGEALATPRTLDVHQVVTSTFQGWRVAKIISPRVTLEMVLRGNHVFRKLQNNGFIIETKY